MKKSFISMTTHMIAAISLALSHINYYSLFYSMVATQVYTTNTNF